MSEWRNIATAPRDGREVIVAAREHAGDGPYHELPYRLRFLKGRWCYARTGATVFWWHEPKRWREDDLIESAAA